MLDLPILRFLALEDNLFSGTLPQHDSSDAVLEVSDDFILVYLNVSNQHPAFVWLFDTCEQVGFNRISGSMSADLFDRMPLIISVDFSLNRCDSFWTINQHLMM